VGAAQRRKQRGGLARYDLASLRELETGTSAAPIELVRRLRERFPACTLRIYYGSTEAGIAALGDTDALRKPGSVGVAPPGGELRRGDDGEVRARSPSSARTSAS
jgi:long-chain acyl-CoA synthetase